jgi:hypothetical protein
MHGEDPEQLELAHLSAHRIVNGALSELVKIFPQLSFRFRHSRDRWLLDALFSRKGCFLLERQNQDVTRPLVHLRRAGYHTLQLRHNDWIDFVAESTITPNAPSGTTERDRFVASVRNPLTAFFSESQITHKADLTGTGN